MNIDRSHPNRWSIELDEPRRNALSSELVADLSAVLSAAANQQVRLVTLQSAGDVFASGLDLSGLDEETDRTLALRLLDIAHLLEMIATAPFVSVAIIDGPAVGAGADLAIACDVRLATRAASFRFPGPKFGIVLGTGRLAQLVGDAQAAVLALTGGKLDAASAEARGTIVGVDDMEHAERLTEQIAVTLANGPAAFLPSFRDALRGRLPGAGWDAITRTTLAAPGLRDRIAAYVAEQR